MISIFRTTAGIAVAVLAVGCSSKAASPAKASATTIAQGLAKQKAGDVAGAKKLFQQAADRDPKSYLAHYDLGAVAQQGGDTATALSEYALALAIDPTYVPALYNTGVIYGATNPALAITTYRRVVQLQPVAPTAYLNLGLTEIATGDEAQGVADVRTAIGQDPTLAPGLPADIKAKLAAKPAKSAATTPAAGKSSP